MKTAAIIGASSMLGARLASTLSADGVRVITVGRSETADICLDLETGFLRTFPESFSADTLYHCAAGFFDDSREGLKKNFQVNTAGSLWALELAERLSCKTIVYAGSVSSMERLDPGKFGSYGFTKAQAEALLAWGMKRLGGRFCSLRFSQIYDVEGACIRHQPWFGRIIAYAARGLDINLPPSMGVRNFIHVNDAAQVLVAAGYHPTADGVFDVIHPQSLTFHEIAEIAYSVFGKGGQISTDSRKQPFREIHFPDGLHTVETFNSIPYISLAAGISEIRDRGTWTEFGPLDVT